MVRNVVLIVSWPTLRQSSLRIFRRVSVVSCKIVVACKKQEQRETIVDDQQDMDISKAADAVVEREHVGGQLKTPTVSSLIFRERTLCSEC